MRCLWGRRERVVPVAVKGVRRDLEPCHLSIGHLDLGGIASGVQLRLDTQADPATLFRRGHLREIGRIDRTLFTLDWLQSPELRRRVTVGLNKGEAKNALSRAVCFHRRGMVQDRTFD